MFSVLLDSSSTYLSVGIAKDGALLDEISYEAWQQQSEYMIIEINKLLEKHNVDKNDIKEIGVCIGPGSYTGVRISITIAKVMALACDAKIYAISSLMALKDGCNKSICLINARSGRSYVGIYEGNKCLTKDVIWKNEEVIDFINAHKELSVCGDTKYLQIENVKTDSLKEMNDIMKAMSPIEDILALKPTYMSD